MGLILESAESVTNKSLYNCCKIDKLETCKGLILWTVND